MSYFIKGNKERGPEVIKLLESKGGINKYNFKGNGVQRYYYIGKDKCINNCNSNDKEYYILKDLCEELTLHEKWVSQYNIGDKIQTLHTHKKGTIINIDSMDKTYRISFENDIVVWCNEDEIELYKWTPKRGETVLVRDSDDDIWKEGIFSFKNSTIGFDRYYMLSGLYYCKCIPFDENKLGKVTDD